MDIINMIVADDHAIVRQGLIKIIELNSEFKVVAEASNGLEAINLSIKYEPDIILMDINMPNVDGIEACRKILESRPRLKIVALTVCEEVDKISKVLEAGAKGYILKNTNIENLTRIIKQVHEGKSYLDPSVTPSFIELYNNLVQKVKEYDECPLTERELEVLEYVAKGHTNIQIAKILFLSEKTVKNHVSNILRKLDATDRTEACMIAKEKQYM